MTLCAKHIKMSLLDKIERSPLLKKYYKSIKGFFKNGKYRRESLVLMVKHDLDLLIDHILIDIYHTSGYKDEYMLHATLSMSEIITNFMANYIIDKYIETPEEKRLKHIFSMEELEILNICLSYIDKKAAAAFLPTGTQELYNKIKIILNK